MSDPKNRRRSKNKQLPIVIPIERRVDDVILGRYLIQQSLWARDQSAPIKNFEAFNAQQLQMPLRWLPAQVGSEVLLTARGPASSRLVRLFERYGERPGIDNSPAQRLYFATYHRVMSRGEFLRVSNRSITKWRLAAVILEELATAEYCLKCSGSGLEGEAYCSKCGGTGFMRASKTWRALECGCKPLDFEGRVEPLYEDVLLGLIGEERRMLGMYMSLLRGMFGPKMVEDAINQGMKGGAA